MAWEKILADYVTGKGLISKIYKKLGILKIKINAKKFMMKKYQNFK